MNLLKKQIANLVTLLRIVGSVYILFTDPFFYEFFIIYTLCGFTDMIDGPIARLCNSDSILGSIFDGIADVAFIGCVTYKLFPKLIRMIPKLCVYLAIIALILKLMSYTIGAIKFKTFAFVHTILNKSTGILLFFIPYIVCFADLYSYIHIVALLAVVTAIEELIIIIKLKEFNPNIRSILQKDAFKNN